MPVKDLFISIKNKLTIEAVIFFILIPIILTVICISVQFFPKLKDILILQPLKPTLINIFFSSYTHLTFGHLLNNLKDYIVVISLILVLKTDRKSFLINMLLIFFILPLLISIYIIYYEPNSLPGSGFSGILSGLIGYLPYSVYRYIKKEWGIHLTSNFLFLIIVFNMLLIVIIYRLFFNRLFFNLIYFGFLFLLLIAIYIIRDDLERIIDKLKYLFVEYKTGSKNFINFFVFLITLWIVFFGAPFELFPSNIITDGGRVDISVHFIGYLFGILVPSIFVDNLMQKIPRASMVVA